MHTHSHKCTAEEGGCVAQIQIIKKSESTFQQSNEYLGKKHNNINSTIFTSIHIIVYCLIWINKGSVKIKQVQLINYNEYSNMYVDMSSIPQQQSHHNQKKTFVSILLCSYLNIGTHTQFLKRKTEIYQQSPLVATAGSKWMYHECYKVIQYCEKV